jgi:ABC-type uncharacterized transport system involved in gliding motility auxiliary subunit
MQLIGAGAGLLGLILAFAALGYVLVQGTAGSADVPRNLLLAALALLTIFVWLNPEAIARVITGRGTRYGANAILRILVAVGIAVLIYAIWGLLAPRIGGGFGRLDVTAEQQFTLSPLTEQTLRNLSQPVRVIGFFTPGEFGRSDAENLLKEYTARSSNIKVEFIDPTIDVLTARQYNLTRSGVVVFDNSARREQASANTEEAFTAALLRLGETGTKTIAVLDVPSLVDFTGTGSQQMLPMSLVQAELTNQNYVFLPPYNLAISPTISINDVTVLIVPPSPFDAPLSEQAIRAIRSYLDGGGHVLLMTDPQAAPLPTALLQPYGLTEYHDVILENNQSNVWALPGTPMQPFNIIVSTYPGATITKDMTGLRTFYSVASAIQPPTSTITGFVSIPIVQSSGDATLARIVPDASGGASLQPVEGGPTAPLNLIMGVEADPATTTVTNTQQTTPTHRMRLVVTGDADFARDDFIQTFQFVNNRDLFTNIINWLAESESRISIPPRTTNDRRIDLDAAQGNIIFTTSVLLMPFLVLLLGGVIWWRRR